MNLRDFGYFIVYRRFISSSREERFYFKFENLATFSKTEADNLCFGFKTIIFFMKLINYFEYLIGEIGG